MKPVHKCIISGGDMCHAIFKLGNNVARAVLFLGWDHGRRNIPHLFFIGKAPKFLGLIL